MTGTTQVRLSITDQPNDVKIEVDKSAPEQIQGQEKFLYTVEKIRNTGNCSVDNFTLTDILPSQVELTELWTGTFQGLKDADSYSIWYQTNRNGAYRLWKDKLPADVNSCLTKEGLNLTEGEKITAFQYRFGTVKPGFAETEKPVYYVQAGSGLADGEKLVNHIELTADKLGIAYTVEDETFTRIVKPENPVSGSGGSSPARVTDVPTGDNTSAALHLCLACTAAAALVLVWSLHGKSRKLQKTTEKAHGRKGEQKP